MVPFLSALLLFLAGMLIINWQLWNMATLNNAGTASTSTLKIDDILAEAVSAAKKRRMLRQKGAPAPDSKNWERKLR
jgi:hypothetical protein